MIELNMCLMNPLNAMLNDLVRGHPRDFDAWANVTEDPQWTYDNLLPYFKSVESYEGEFDNGETPNPFPTHRL
jgi:choline dehydrogenase-like flavoprotein